MINNKRSLAKYKIDYHLFDERLYQETRLLEKWFIEQRFMERGLEIGSEIEFFQLDEHFNPAPENLKLINIIKKPYFVCEVGVAQLEMNTPHVSLIGNCFSQLHEHILRSWRYCCQKAQENGYQLALIGSLPTAGKDYVASSHITNHERYALIERCMQEQRDGQPMSIDIIGEEHLSLPKATVAINGLISALQLHIQIGLSQSVRFYNTAQAISGPMVAMASNSPYLLGKQLWHDSRIPCFDQVMTLPRFDRAQGFKSCYFGTNYLRESFFELFEQNYQFYPRLIPEVAEDLDLESMFHVRRQNGVVYRWNRPVIDFNADEQPHLRIEHRGPSTGPTIVDMIANAALFYGLIYYFSIQSTPIESILPFHTARKNFYQAARYGLHASLTWFAGQEMPAFQLLKQLLPLARKGLQALAIDNEDIDYYLGIIAKRLEIPLNGSTWQICYMHNNGHDLNQMLAAYIENQSAERPVAEWKIK